MSYSAEKAKSSQIKSMNNSPQVGPSMPSCARSLLLEPDMEDLLSNLPGTADFKNLDHEEEHANGGATSEAADLLL